MHESLYCESDSSDILFEYAKKDLADSTAFAQNILLKHIA